MVYSIWNLFLRQSGPLTLSWRRSLSYRNQSIDLLCKSVDWFLYDNDLHHERVNHSLYWPLSEWSDSKIAETRKVFSGLEEHFSPLNTLFKSKSTNTVTIARGTLFTFKNTIQIQDYKHSHYCPSLGELDCVCFLVQTVTFLARIWWLNVSTYGHTRFLGFNKINIQKFGANCPVY